MKGQEAPYLNPDPFCQWIGPKNLGEAVINGEFTTCLLDNGAQLNFIMRAYARRRNMNVFPLERLAEEVGDAIPPICTVPKSRAAVDYTLTGIEPHGPSQSV